MNFKERRFYKRNLREVLHTTLNPYEPGAVRIHLVPAKYRPFRADPSVVILNGKDILPLNLSWTILLANFIKEVNAYNGGEVTEEDLEDVIEKTLDATFKVYHPKRDDMRKDLKLILQVFIDISQGRKPSVNVGQMSLAKYASKMTAPHRMDLLVSSMTKDGNWNCNQKCLHCYAAGQPMAEVQELSTEDWKKIIDKCKKAKIPQLTFTGGEPTIRKDLVELVKYASWFVTRLNTNGVLLTEELCKELMDASLDSIQITFYSNNMEKHNTLVGSENYTRTVDGIKNAIKAGLAVSINTPLCKINDDYVETLKFLHELGVKYVTCSGLIMTGNAEKEDSKSTQLSNTELFEILEKAKKYCDDNLMEIAFTSPGWIESKKLSSIGLNVPTCGACLSNMAITPDGKIVPCQSWLKNEDVLGDMLKGDWKKIWESQKCSKIRANSAKLENRCPLKEGGC